MIRDRMADGGAVEKGTAVVIATVKGDIHDIGKNIVKVLLENYGYNVIDLGKDVAVEAIVKAVLGAQGSCCRTVSFDDDYSRCNGSYDSRLCVMSATAV